MGMSVKEVCMSILEAVGQKTELKKVSSCKGGEYAGACPICGGKDRFRVWPADRGGEGSYWCRGCERAGDLVQWLVDFCGLEYREAFRAAGRDSSDHYSPKRYQPTCTVSNAQKEFEPRHHENPSGTWEVKARKLVDESHARLLGNGPVLGWLAARGLDLDTVKRFSLGWLPGERDNPCMWRPRSAWGLPEVFKDNGAPKKLWIPRGVVVPWIENDKVMRLKIRRPKADLGNGGAKYYVMPGSSSEPCLFNPNQRAFVVVESEFDGMLIIAKAGGQVGVLALGSAVNKPGTGSFARLRGALRILNALDSDTAGENASKWWGDEFNNVRRWPVPSGKDPGEYFSMGGDILSWVVAGLPPVMSMSFKRPQDSVQEGVCSPGCEVMADIPTDQKSANHVPSDGCQTVENEWPESILTIGAILKDHPIKVRATGKHADIVAAPGFNNDGVMNQLQRLVYWDIDGRLYLIQHPCEWVHGDNFYSRKAGK